MPIPLLVAGAMMAPSIVSGIMGYLNDSEANEISAQERQKLEGLLAQVQDPQFSPDQLTPESYSVLQQYVPQVASFVQEVAPQVVTGQGAEAQYGKGIERDVLNQMLGVAQTGHDETTDIEQNRARRASDSAAQSARATADATQARRGFAPTGALSYALSNEATNAGLDRNAMAGEQSVMDAAQRRTSALKDSAGMATGIANRDIEMERNNANVMNAFNQRMASNQNQYNQYATGVQNTGQQFNIGQNQGAYDKGVAGRNAAQQYNIGRNDNIAQAKTDAAFKRLGVQGNLSGMAREDARAEADTKNRAWGTAAQAAAAGLGAAKEAGAFNAANPQAKVGEYSVDLDPEKRFKERNPYGYA